MEVGHQHLSLSEWNADLFAVRSMIWCDMTDWEESKEDGGFNMQMIYT